MNEKLSSKELLWQLYCLSATTGTAFTIFSNGKIHLVGYSLDDLVSLETAVDRLLKVRNKAISDHEKALSKLRSSP